MDAMWANSRKLLNHFDQSWLRECRTYKPKPEEWRGFEEALEKHVLAMYEMAIDKSCLPNHDLMLKESSIKGRLDFLPEILNLKVDIHTAFNVIAAPVHSKQPAKQLPKSYFTVLTLEYFMKDLLHKE